MAVCMSDEPIPSPEKNTSTAASPTRSGPLQKIWSTVNNRILEVVVGLILAGLSYIAYNSWDTIVNISRNSLYSMIIAAVQEDINKDNSKLRMEIESKILEDEKFREKAGTILESTLKQKGTLFSGRITLNNSKIEDNINIFWRPGHSTFLFVKVNGLGIGESIRLVPPRGIPQKLTKPTVYYFNVGDLLKVAVGSYEESIRDATKDDRDNAIVAQPSERIFENLYTLTFKLELRVPAESKNSDILTPVDIEYAEMTTPLVDMDETK
jgi:hypothetical protein